MCIFYLLMLLLHSHVVESCEMLVGMNLETFLPDFDVVVWPHVIMLCPLPRVCLMHIETPEIDCSPSPGSL